MLMIKVFRSFCRFIFVLGVLLSFAGASAYASSAEFTFDMPPGSYELGLPLDFEDNGVIMNAYSDAYFWRQTDRYNFIGLSGGVLTNGLRLAEYPSETLSLRFSGGMTNFSTDFAIVSHYPTPRYLALVAYSGSTVVGGVDAVGMDNGSISLSLSTPFDRVELTSSDMVDFAIDNVNVNNVPLPGGLLLMSSGMALLLGLRMKRRWGVLRGYSRGRQGDR